MAQSGPIVRVEGLRDLQRAFARADKALAEDLRDALMEAASPVRTYANALAIMNIRRIYRSPQWARMRIGVTRGDIRGAGGLGVVAHAGSVYVAPVERGVKGKNQTKRRGAGTGPPSFADLMMDRAMEPALERMEGKIMGRVNDALNDVHRVWERA